jgi:methyl-accepting chemotaxis protein
MGFLLNLRVGPRLGLGYGLLIVLLLVVGGSSSWIVKHLAGQLDTTANSNLVKIRAANRLEGAVSAVAAASRDLLLLDEARQIKKQRALIDQAQKDTEAAMAELRASQLDAADRASLDTLQQAQEAYAKAITKFLGVVDGGNPDDSRESLVGDLRPAQKAYRDSLQALVSQQFDTAHDQAARGGQLANTAAIATLCLVLVGTVVGGASAYVIARSVVAPVQQAEAAVQAINRGDLTRRIEVRGNDEVSRMLGAMNEMQATLAAVVANVSEAAEDVVNNSNRISHSNADLSVRTGHAAANLQQTAASIEQISGTLAGTRGLTQRATQIAGDARSAASEGGAAVQSVIQTMQQIAQSSSKIRDIIGVIDGIAFQTNILALNAAVEAARAGEHGKGFAVVAAEVRALASRSATASREIRELIQRSVEQVDDGSHLVNAAGVRIDGVVERVNEMNQLINEIATAASEQAEGVGVVHHAMSELDSSTQQNTNLVEELSSSARALEDGATRLLGSVGFFRNTASA